MHTYSRCLTSYYIAGYVDDEKILFRPRDYYERNNVTPILGKKVVKLLPHENCVILNDGSRVGYSSLMIGTGASPVIYNIPGNTKDGVFVLRTYDDACKISEAASAGKDTALWLMAAPSGFAFYKAFIELCRADEVLKRVLRKTRYFQFDDYPVGRKDPRFPITFRHLLETYFFHPLQDLVGKLDGIHLMELEGEERDTEIAEKYSRTVLSTLEDPGTFVVELKGTGMDGHWGFHGSETPLDTPPKIVQVPMNSQNIHQQKLDWPQYFKTDADVPRIAYSFTVSAFLEADFIVDNVPQPTKEFSVLATYGTDQVLNEVPSSALKTHPHAVAVLTEASARALLEYREGIARGNTILSEDTLLRLRRLWSTPDRPETEEENIRNMELVLKKLGMIR
jgi:6-phosphogluconolactonase/glucosamine-6-phosphate isomerase/deaminase